MITYELIKYSVLALYALAATICLIKYNHKLHTKSELQFTKTFLVLSIVLGTSYLIIHHHDVADIIRGILQ